MFTMSVMQSVISLVMGTVETLLLLRVILKLLGANVAAPIVSWTYETTSPLLAPFQGMFPQPTLRGGVIIEFSTLFALLAYSMIGYLLLELINFIDLSIKGRNKKRREDQ